MGFAGGSMSTVGDDVVAVYEVRGEHAVVSGETGAGARHRASSLRERHFRGGEAGDAKSAGLPICTAGGCPEEVRHTDVPQDCHATNRQDRRMCRMPNRQDCRFAPRSLTERRSFETAGRAM